MYQMLTSRLKKFFLGFKFAFDGIIYTVKTQTNFRFHITAMIWVLLLSLFYDFSGTEYAVLFLTISSVLTLEAVNTAIEKAVDLCTEEQHKLAKAAKDAAAGAVLIAAIFSVIIAFFIFWDKSVFLEIAAFFIAFPLMWLAVLVLAVISFIFIFKGL